MMTKWFLEEVLPHEPDLRAWLRSRFPGNCDVDDVVQESYLRLWTARRGSPVACARAYLFTTARNVALGLFRRPAIFSPLGSDDPAPARMAQEEADVAEQVCRRQETTFLLAAIDGLPERCREIFILRKLHSVPQREIATRLRLSERTVEAQVARGSRRVADHLQRRGVTRSGASERKHA